MAHVLSGFYSARTSKDPWKRNWPALPKGSETGTLRWPQLEVQGNSEILVLIFWGRSRASKPRPRVLDLLKQADAINSCQRSCLEYWKLTSYNLKGITVHKKYFNTSCWLSWAIHPNFNEYGTIDNKLWIFEIRSCTIFVKLKPQKKL